MFSKGPEKIDVLWLIEHVARELDVACAVKAIAEDQYDLRIGIMPLHSDVAYLTSRYDPKIIAIPYGFSAENAKIPDLLSSWPEKIYLNLSWEELYYKAYRSARAPRDEWSQKCIIHHVWGDFFKEYLIGHGVPPENIYVNGQLAYKLYDLPYKDFFLKGRDFFPGLDPDRKWIFFPENYGWAFRSDNTLKKISDSHNITLDALKEMKEYCDYSLRKVLKWALEVVKTSDVEFIIRPRPATPQADFEKFVYQQIGSLPSNLHITNTATVREWILASDIVLSSISTSLIEAAIAGRPAYMVEPEAIPLPLQDDWHQYVTHLTSFDAFSAICTGSQYNDSSLRLGKWARSMLLSTGDPIKNLAVFMTRLCHDPAALSEMSLHKAAFLPKAKITKHHVAEQDRFNSEKLSGRASEFSVLLINNSVSPAIMHSRNGLSDQCSNHKSPNHWLIQESPHRIYVQEYAGHLVAYSEGTSLMTRLKYQTDLYEPETVLKLCEKIEQYHVSHILDIGSNIGLISLALLSHFPRLQIDAFDAGPHQCDLLRMTIQTNHLQGQLRLHQVALGDKNGTSHFHVHSTIDVSGDGIFDTERAGETTKITVRMQTLDSWWKENGRPNASLIKMDTEGAELFVLKGASEYLQKVRPVIFLEICPLNLKNYPYTANDVFFWLRENSYKLETLTGEEVTTKNCGAMWKKPYNFIAYYSS